MSNVSTLESLICWFYFFFKISPSSNIWGSPKLDKENTNKGPANTQSPLTELLKAEGKKKHVQRRPFSPAFEVCAKPVENMNFFKNQ